MSDAQDNDMQREQAEKSNRRIAASAAFLAVAMIGVSFAAVPLYDMFCRVTGFGGTTQVAIAAPGAVSERMITVRFDASINRKMPWRFDAPEAGIYFSKIDCFCFTEQVLAPGEAVDMPVSFFIDPEILTDREMDDVKTITLSYTFFEATQQASSDADTSRITKQGEPARPQG